MKTRILTLLCTIAFVSTANLSAQSYNDDAYYHPKLAKKHSLSLNLKEDKSVEGAKVQPASLATRDVDEYNRRGIADKASSSDSVLISAEEYQEFQYSERIRRFHDADFTTHITDDGYMNIYLEEGAEVTIFYDDNRWDDYYYHAWMSPWAYDMYYRPYWTYNYHYYTYDYHWHRYHHDWYYWGGYDPWYYGWSCAFYDPFWPSYHHHHHHHPVHRPHHPNNGPHDAWGHPTYYAGRRPSAISKDRSTTTRNSRSAVYNDYASARSARSSSSVASRTPSRGSSSTAVSTGRTSSTRQPATTSGVRSSSSSNRGSATSSGSSVRRGSSSSSSSSAVRSGSSSSSSRGSSSSSSSSSVGRSSSSSNRSSSSSSSSRSSSSSSSSSSSRSSYSGSSSSYSRSSSSSYSSGSSFSGSSFSGSSRSSGSSYSGGGGGRSGGSSSGRR